VRAASPANVLDRLQAIQNVLTMEFNNRQKYELALLVLLSLVVTLAALAAGRFDLVSGPRAQVLYDNRNTHIQAVERENTWIEGDWQITPEGLTLQHGQSGTVTLRLQNAHVGRTVAYFYGHGGPGLNASIAISDDGQYFREVAREISFSNERVDLTPAADPDQTIWLRVKAFLPAIDETGGTAYISRIRVVSLQPPLRLPNLPLASLLILTPTLAYLTRGLVRPTGQLAYAMAVLFGLTVLTEALAETRLALDQQEWWRAVLASKQGTPYLLAPYVTLLGLLGWQVRIGRGALPQQRMWSYFALGGVLAMAGASRLGSFIEVVPGMLSDDAAHYMQLAKQMRTPYDTGAQFPFWIWMIKGWFWLTGYSDVHLRLFTVVLSLLMLVVAYKFFRDYTGQPLVGIFVAALLGANPYLVVLSVRGLREEAYIIAILCFLYVVMVPTARWSLRQQAIWLAMSGAAVQLLRFNSYIFLIPLLLVWAWKQGPRQWKAVALPLVFIVAVSIPHMAHNYRQFGDPMYSVNIHFDFMYRIETENLKRVGCEGCRSWDQSGVSSSTEGSLGAYEYLFELHSVREVLVNTIRGYFAMYLWPTHLFEIQSGIRSWIGVAFYVLGLGLVLFGPYRGLLAVIVLLANGVPFWMALGIDPRLCVHTAPFVTFIFSYALWWSFEQASRGGTGGIRLTMRRSRS